MARMRSRLGHVLLLIAVLAPLLTGVVVRTYAWMTLLSDRGVVNSILLDLGVREMVLLSNSPARKIVGLEGYGLKVAGHRSLGS